MDDDVLTDTRHTDVNALASQTKEAEQGISRISNAQISTLIDLIEKARPDLAARQVTPTEIIAEQDKYINQLEWTVGIFCALVILMFMARR